MFKREKMVTVCTWSEMTAEKSGEFAVKKTLPAAMLGTSLLVMTSPVAAEGYVEGKVKERIIDAFDPIVELIQAAAYPIGFVMMSVACLIIMAGNRARGLAMIKMAGLGFVLIQFVPALMDILVDVSDAMNE